MSQTQPLPPKKEVALALLERSNVHVHLDPREGTVVVPARFKKQAQLVLQIGLNMPVPIPDLRLDDDGMTCTLSFDRVPFLCVVPWVCVFAMVGDDGRWMVWPDDVPAEVARQAQVRAVEVARKEEVKPASVREPKADGDRPRRARKRPALASVPESARQESVPAQGKGSRLPDRGAPATPVGAQRPAAVVPVRAARAAKKKKRDLPPYLRVVK